MLCYPDSSPGSCPICLPVAYPSPWNVAVGAWVVTVVLPSWLVPVTLACLPAQEVSYEHGVGRSEWLSQWSYSLSLGLPVYTMKLPPTFSALRRSGTVSTCTPSVNGLISITASDMTWQVPGGPLWRVEQHSLWKPGEREVLAGCPLTGTLGSGAFTATEHSPPRQQLPFPFVSCAAVPLVV